jgi:predicted nucleic acid-binding protein
MLLIAEKRQRITPAERRQALAPLAGLPVPIDPDTAAQARGQTLSLAETQGLTMNDLSYLEFALRLALPLALLDKGLRTAAAVCGLGRFRP